MAGILVAEDSATQSAQISGLLQEAKYEVTVAGNGKEALHRLEGGESFDLVLTDMVMPEMDGPTMLRELRKRGIKTKVVFVSGYAEDAFEKNLEGQTDFAFLPKPFTLKQLAEAVKEAIG